ncbi:MAG TPA: hypothetical protein VLD37_00360 [Candidatus Bilamarchaeum sp.]|nr:hypothetical protein [Candidatus Bilamarchaeum sp.]
MATPVSRFPGRVELRLTPGAFSRLKDRLEAGKFDELEIVRDSQKLDAMKDFGRFRLRVAVTYGQEKTAIRPFRVRGRIIFGPDSELPVSLISRAFPNHWHGYIALRYEEIELQGFAPEPGPYRVSGPQPAESEHVDFARMLRAAQELDRAREEAARILSHVLTREVPRKGTPDKEVMFRIIGRIRESGIVSAAVSEHIPDCV